MSNLLTRRLALFRIAVGSAVAATASVPAILDHVPSKVAEDPRLIKLGQKLAKVDAIRKHRAGIKRQAQRSYEATCPPIPEELIQRKDASKLYLGSEREIDCEYNYVWPDDPTKPSRWYHTAGNIEDALEHAPNLSGRHRKLNELLCIARTYEREVKIARDISGIGIATEKHEKACEALERVALQLADIPSLTPDGITIKAVAYEAYASIGSEQLFRAGATFGPELAADICRILSDRGAA
jgi:hypothetical protein